MHPTWKFDDSSKRHRDVILPDTWIRGIICSCTVPYLQVRFKPAAYYLEFMASSRECYPIAYETSRILIAIMTSTATLRAVPSFNKEGRVKGLIHHSSEFINQIGEEGGR